VKYSSLGAPVEYRNNRNRPLKIAGDLPFRTGDFDDEDNELSFVENLLVSSKRFQNMQDEEERDMKNIENPTKDPSHGICTFNDAGKTKNKSNPCSN
jgi:hypothetical protein